MADAAAVRSAEAPAPIGPYSQAIRSGGLLFCSGQIAIDPATGKLIDGDVAAQTRRVLANIAAVLAAGGSGPERVLKTTIYLVEIADFATVNPIYGEFFNGPQPPARSTVAVAALPLGARVEIEVVALTA